jgi:hypothetical protein
MRLSSLAIFSVILLSACVSVDTTRDPTTEEGIKSEIVKANYCETATDCVDVGAKCPFDCYIYVNKDQAPRIKKLVDGFPSQCEYSCIAIQGVECVQNVCKVIPDGLVEPENDSEGNVGAACTDDAECVTPGTYLMQSVCPFTSKCLEGSCAVVCPTDDKLTPGRE